MTLQSIGDLARHFSMSLQNRSLRTAMGQATKELTSGQKTDLPRDLGASAARLQALRHESRQIASFQAAAEEVSQTLSISQAVLEQFSTRQTDLSSTLLAVSLPGTAQDIGRGAEQATAAFEDMVALLNTSFAGRSLFAGTAENAPATAPATEILESLRLAIAGAPDVATVETTINDWFMQPGGGYEAMGYLGDTGGVSTRRVGPDLDVTLAPRADEPAFRQALAATALAALSADANVPANNLERAELLRHSAEALLSADFGLTRLRADLGSNEARLEDQKTELSARKTALDLMSNDMALADPFEAAGRLQALQLQLETHYTVTARLARLSLSEYLR
jgi:flagellar hook-associated protein 3 FlgL